MTDSNIVVYYWIDELDRERERERENRRQMREPIEEIQWRGKIKEHWMRFSIWRWLVQRTNIVRTVTILEYRKAYKEHISRTTTDRSVEKRTRINTDDLTVGENAEAQKERWKHFNWTIKIAFNLLNSFIYLLFIWIVFNVALTSSFSISSNKSPPKKTKHQNNENTIPHRLIWPV